MPVPLTCASDCFPVPFTHTSCRFPRFMPLSRTLPGVPLAPPVHIVPSLPYFPALTLVPGLLSYTYCI
jgi:hypothetical protein